MFENLEAIAADVQRGAEVVIKKYGDDPTLPSTVAQANVALEFLQRIANIRATLLVQPKEIKSNA